MVALYVTSGHICQIKTYQTEPSFVYFKYLCNRWSLAASLLYFISYIFCFKCKILCFSSMRDPLSLSIEACGL